MLPINGKMGNIRQVAAFVPVYLVNAPDAIIEKYKKADDVNTSLYYCRPAKVVSCANSSSDLPLVSFLTNTKAARAPIAAGIT